MRFLLPVVALSTLALAGCSTSFAPQASSAVSTQAAGPITGSLFGGRQAIVGAHVFLLENGITGNAGPGIAASAVNASVSLLTGAGTTNDTATGFNYVLTSASGGFSISGDYTCDPGRQVYIYAVGGMPDGQTTNTNAANMVALGACPSAGIFSSSLRVYMNEVSTVALAYAAAGYASDATHLSTSGTSLATTGIANAFRNAAQLYDISASANGTGAASARTLTPNGQGTVPAALLNTLANSIAACVNSATGSPQCATLFANAKSGGATGTTPTDTASAVLNIAHNPANAVATIFTLPGATGYPFQPMLGTAPNDFTVAITFPYLPTDDTNNSQSPVVDANGNVWLGNTTTAAANNNGYGSLLRYSPLGDLTEFTTSITTPNWMVFSASNTGWVTNQTSGYGFLNLGPDQPTPTIIDTDFYDPQFLVFDAAGHAWVNEGSSGTLSVYDSTGAHVTVDDGSGNQVPLAAKALDGLNLWIYPQPDHAGHLNTFALDANYNVAISQVAYAGGALQQTTFTPPNATYSYTQPFLADSADNLWTYAVQVSNGALVLQKFSNTGTLLQTYPGPATFTNAYTPAVDGAGTFWVSDGTHLAAQTSAGTVLSPGNGFQYSATSPTHPGTLAIDGSGDVWVTTSDSSNTYIFLYELIGAATPTITPISPNNPANPTLTGLGVRP